jgi:hypothetical protein
MSSASTTSPRRTLFDRLLGRNRTPPPAPAVPLAPLAPLPPPEPPKPQYVAPAPAAIAREDPAIDVDDSGIRTGMFDATDAETAAESVSQCLNMWLNTWSEILRLLSAETRLFAVARRDGQRYLTSAKAAKDLVQQADRCAEKGDQAAAEQYRGRACEEARVADVLDQTANVAEGKLADCILQLEAIASRVQANIGAIQLTWWAGYHERARQDPWKHGTWRTAEQQRQAVTRKFEDLFGDAGVPSEAEIEQLIRKYRAAARAAGRTAGAPSSKGLVPPNSDVDRVLEHRAEQQAAEAAASDAAGPAPGVTGPGGEPPPSASDPSANGAKAPGTMP